MTEPKAASVAKAQEFTLGIRTGYMWSTHASLIIPSKTNDGEDYLVHITHEGHALCHCKGFRYRAKCWHADEVRELVKNETAVMKEKDEDDD